MSFTKASDYKYLDKSVKMSEKYQQQYIIPFKYKRYMILYTQYIVFIVDYNGKICDVLYSKYMTLSTTFITSYKYITLCITLHRDDS